MIDCSLASQSRAFVPCLFNESMCLVMRKIGSDPLRNSDESLEGLKDH